MKPITILLAEDHMIFREGLRSLLQAEADMEVVGEAHTGRQAVELARKLHPAVIVMEIAIPLLNGLEATRQILKTVPTTKVLILAAHRDDAWVDQAIALGAAGYLVKQNSFQVLVRAIREVQKGTIFFGPYVARRLHDLQRKSFDRGGLPGKEIPQLSSREVEVLQLIAEGAANKQVATKLGISIKTVENHRQNIMAKLAIHDGLRSDAIRHRGRHCRKQCSRHDPLASRHTCHRRPDSAHGHIMALHRPGS